MNIGNVENSKVTPEKMYKVEAAVTMTESQIANETVYNLTAKQMFEWLAGKPFEQIKLEELNK